MKLLKSKRFELPTICFITDIGELKELPLGFPWIYGKPEEEEFYVRLIEYEVLYQRCLETGLPFNWKEVLQLNGLEPVEVEWHVPEFSDLESEEGWDEIIPEHYDKSLIKENNGLFREYIKDCCAYVDISKINELEIFPKWSIKDFEEILTQNIHNFATINPSMYNKNLEGFYGGVEMSSPKRNCIICDISSSMTKSISTFTLLFSKTWGLAYYCDILVTGSISVLYPYEMLHELDLEKVYEIDMGNEGDYFKKIVSEPKEYQTVMVYGDNDHPGGYAKRSISDEDGKKLCKWKIEKLISFHKDSNRELAGYSRWFTVPESNIERIKNWVKYLK